MQREYDHITVRLNPETIIARTETSHDAWVTWALFWYALGGLCGSALTLLALSMTGRI